MIITCPNCSARYKVKDGLIKENGKKVKCKKCGTVFIAYPDKDAVTVRKPEEKQQVKADSAAAETVEHAVAQDEHNQSQEQENDAPQATVKVDRSKLANYIKQAGAETGAATPENRQFQNFIGQESLETQPLSTDNGSGQATVQVDRSQIDAFLKKSSASEKNATIKMDQDQLESLRQQNQVQQEPEEPGPAETVQIDTSQISSMLQSEPQARADEDDREITGGLQIPVLEEGPEQPDIAAEAPDNSVDWPSTPVEPPFPSDEDLGLNAAEDFSELAEPSEEILPSIPSISEVEIDDFSQSDTGTANAMENAETLQTQSQQTGSDDKLYQAKVDDILYPNLTLANIGRWIEEGRLLETDQIALLGTDDYRRADEFPEVVPFFIKFYGAKGEAQQTAQPEPKKKGLFGWFSSLFKKS